jgi:hypothetical protein
MPDSYDLVLAPLSMCRPGQSEATACAELDGIAALQLSELAVNLLGSAIRGPASLTLETRT